MCQLAPMQICNYIRFILEKERHSWSIVRSFQRNNLLVFNDIDKTANLFCFCGFFLVKFSVPGISTKSSCSEASLKTLTLAELDKSYLATAWTQVFTDGSAEILQEMEDVASTSDSQTSLPLLQQYRVEICAQTTQQKHQHSSPRQRLSPNWREDQRRLCPHRLPICTAITRIRKAIRLRVWERSGRSAGEKGKQEAAAKIQTYLPRSINAHQKQEAN